MRNADTLCLAASMLCVAACGDGPTQAQEPTTKGAAVGDAHAPVTAFVPPTPAGCAGAGAYDACFALDAATPLAVRVTLPEAVRPSAVAIVRFRRVDGVARPLDLDHMKFRVGATRELRLYFQVTPGAYRIAVGVDADNDGDPDGAADDLGWSSVSPDVPVLDEAEAARVDVGTSPIETSFTLASRR